MQINLKVPATGTGRTSVLERQLLLNLVGEFFHTISATSSHCRTSCLCPSRAFFTSSNCIWIAMLLSDVVFALGISRDFCLSPFAVARVPSAFTMCSLLLAFTPSAVRFLPVDAASHLCDCSAQRTGTSQTSSDLVLVHPILVVMRAGQTRPQPHPPLPA